MNGPVQASAAAPLPNSAVRHLLPELVGYALASGVALAVDVAVLAGLFKLAGWPYLAAASVAFVTGATVAYLLSVTFVFRNRHIDRRPVEFGYFVGLGLVGLGVNTAIVFVAVSGAGLDVFVAKLLATGATFITNFTLRRQMLFAPATTRP